MGRRVWGLILFLCLSGLCSASVTESKDYLIFPKDHNFIDLAIEHQMAPALLKKKQMYLLVRLGAAYEQVMACAAPSEDARGLALSLSRATGAADALYASEDDYSVGLVKFSFGELFARHRRWSFDLAALIEKLRQDGWEVFGGVKVASEATGAISAAPVATFASNKTYSFDSLGGGPVVLEGVASPGIYAVPFLMAFGPFLALCGGFLAALAVSKRKDIELARRRKLFAAFMRIPVLSAIAVCLPLSMFAIFSGRLQPIADLWFGSTSVGSSLLPVMFLSMPFPFLLLIPMMKLESRLFSDSADKPDFRASESVPVSKATKSRVLWIAIPLIVVGFAIDLMGISLGQRSGLRLICTLVGYGMMFTAVPAASRIVARRMFGTLDAESDDPVVARVVRLARKAQYPIAGVNILEPRDQTQFVAVAYVNGRISITRRAIEELSEAALDFGIAYALRTKMYRMMSILLLYAVTISGLSAFVAMPWIRDHLSEEARATSILLVIPTMVVLVLPFMWWLIRADSKWRVQDTLKLAPDRAGAVEWVEKSSTPLGAGASKASERNKRLLLSQIESVSRAMGLS